MAKAEIGMVCVDVSTYNELVIKASKYDESQNICIKEDKEEGKHFLDDDQK